MQTVTFELDDPAHWGIAGEPHDLAQVRGVCVSVRTGVSGTFEAATVDIDRVSY